MRDPRHFVQISIFKTCQLIGGTDAHPYNLYHQQKYCWKPISIWKSDEKSLLNTKQRRFISQKTVYWSIVQMLSKIYRKYSWILTKFLAASAYNIIHYTKHTQFRCAIEQVCSNLLMASKMLVHMFRNGIYRYYLWIHLCIFPRLLLACVSQHKSNCHQNIKWFSSRSVQMLHCQQHNKTPICSLFL